MNPIEKYNKRADDVNSLLCVGLDPDMRNLPDKFKDLEKPQFEFNKWVIDQTHEYVASFKMNAAFHEARGPKGMQELEETIKYINQNHPDIFTICDAKRGDIGNSNSGYITEMFDLFGFDAITLHPYLGQESLQPFLDRNDKASIILCRTSNTGSGEFQDLEFDGKPLWQIVAEKVSTNWNTNNNCMLVVGATYPEEMKKIREIVPDMTFLVPGIGAQGGDVKEVMEAGLSDTKGLIIHSARAIIFADDPGTAARGLRDEINQYRQ